MNKKHNHRTSFNPTPKFIFLVACAIQLGCSSKPKTPEEVVHQFATYMSTGNCEKAMELCDENTKSTVQGSIDAGCASYSLKIDSITCKIEDNEAGCYCYQKLDGMEFRAPYLLKRIGNEWKVSSYMKDALSGSKFE